MKFKSFGVIFFILFFHAEPIAAQDFLQLSGVIHVHSTFSSGSHSIEDLVAKAKQRGLDVLCLTDHDLVVMEYGVFPLRNLIKKREERRSVLKLGVDRYLAEIDKINRLQKEVLVIPGVQSSPFYYWTGSPLKGSLTAHNYQKELLLIGMKSPSDYLGLPLLHRGLSKSYFYELLPQCLFFLGSLLLAFYLFLQRGFFRVTGIIIGLFSIALLINHHPFQSSRFDAYHGDQGTAPYQELIDYVRQRNGLTFWTHPESDYSKEGKQLGPIKMVTKHYPDDLISSRNYTGFSALYGDTITITKPGKQWDQILNEYCIGQRANPAWGIASSDFHTEKKGGVELDTFQTVFIVKHKTPAEVLNALEGGKVYAVQKEGTFRLSLDRFEAIDQKTGRKARMGDEIDAQGLPIIEGHISASDGKSYLVKAVLIKAGEVWKTFEGKTPLEFRFIDGDQRKRKIFYRLEVRGPASHLLLSNPIFISS